MARPSALGRSCARLATQPLASRSLSVQTTALFARTPVRTPERVWSTARGFQTTCACAERRTDSRDEKLQGRSSPKSTGPTHSAQEILSNVAFAFDIDGVLYQGGVRIPGAKEMLTKIRSEGVRYVFLTNGGGHHEDAKVTSLLKRLQFSKDDDVIRGRVILSHTPMRGWADKVKKEGTVLITGSHPETARQIAEHYGFARAVTPADIIAANPRVYPFEHLRDSLHSVHRPLPDGKRIPDLKDPYHDQIPHDALKIDQILIWNDPRDWSLDTQIIHDLLISRQGYLGTVSPKNGDASLSNKGWQQDGQPEMWISNMDMFWKTEYPVNRFGTGAFMAALEGVWTEASGGAKLQYKALGKPSTHTYQYAHDRLQRYHADTAGESQAGAAEERRQQQAPLLRRVYMIGDNPESDIRGANEFQPGDGTEWVSILVRTGVWQPTAAEREPRHRPAVVVDDVVDGVAWAMRNEGLDVDREWLLKGSG